MARMWSDEWFAERAAIYAAVQDPRVNAVLDVIAPARRGEGPSWDRTPLFEWGHEETPEPQEMIDLAVKIVAALDNITS